VIPSGELIAEFTAAPNPVLKADGAVNFYWRGGCIESAGLIIYDASGNIVNKISITDNCNTTSRRLVGSWDLRDARNKPVDGGTYLVRGTVIVGGKIETVSLMVGIVR
jgi:hypothetical protein